MAYHAFLEAIRPNLHLRPEVAEDVIPDQAMLYFDQVRAISTHHDEPDAPDYGYCEIGDEDAGALQIKIAGPHFFIWTAAQLTGKSLDGAFLQLRYKRGSEWIPFSGKIHIKSSSSAGMGILNVYEELGEAPVGAPRASQANPLRVGLFNISGQPIHLNREHYLKASLIAFGSGPLGPSPEFEEMQLLNGMFQSLPQPFSGTTPFNESPPGVRIRMGASESIDDVQNESIKSSDDEFGLLAIFEKTKRLFFQMTEPSTPLNFKSPDINGLGVSVLNTGNMYNFWNNGYVDALFPIRMNGDPGSLVKVYLLKSRDDAGHPIFGPLTLYQGEPTVGMCYVQGSVSTESDGFIPIYFDETGVYLEVAPDYIFNVKATYTFIRTLILAEPH